MVAHLEHWGDVAARNLGAGRNRRLLEFRFEAPGDDLEVEIRGLYREYYAAAGPDRWGLDKYTYEYLDIAQRWRLAFHMHDLAGSGRVVHGHCEPANDIPETERSPHLRAVEYGLREAHDVFMTLYAAGLEPDCAGFLPLAIDRT